MIAFGVSAYLASDVITMLMMAAAIAGVAALSWALTRRTTAAAPSG